MSFAPGQRNLHADKCFKTTAEADSMASGLVNYIVTIPSYNLLLIVIPKRYLCCSSMCRVVLPVCIRSLAIWSPESQLSILLPIVI